jgi:hypothetical protein
VPVCHCHCHTGGCVFGGCGSRAPLPGDGARQAAQGGGGACDRGAVLWQWQWCWLWCWHWH